MTLALLIHSFCYVTLLCEGVQSDHLRSVIRVYMLLDSDCFLVSVSLINYVSYLFYSILDEEMCVKL